MSTRNIIIALVAILAIAGIVYGYRRYKASKAASKAPVKTPDAVADGDRVRPGTPVVDVAASELTKMRYA
ncbi:MAG: hypothetical protein QY325_04395 [Flavobacteriales bacterium]|nr:MAG: hypothetical protein QY325_04395 [Flavobacteriales bacterium]